MQNIEELLSDTIGEVPIETASVRAQESGDPYAGLIASGTHRRIAAGPPREVRLPWGRVVRVRPYLIVPVAEGTA